jgi:hypothetical protein
MANKARSRMSRGCATCSRPIRNDNRYGFCKAHVADSPEYVEYSRRKAREWAERNPERAKASRSTHYRENKDLILAKNRVYRASPKGKEVVSNAMRKTQTGFSVALVEQLRVLQQGKCALCSCVLRQRTKAFDGE